MELLHIELKNLKLSPVNVRKKCGKDVSDILPSIRSLGILQPLLVRANCEGFEIVAGQRRYNALSKLAEEGDIESVPCIIMQESDDAKAIEASLAENIARLPMDEIDQYKAFCALEKQGSSIDGIATQFGISERLVKQRLAIGNLIAPILTAYRKGDIQPHTIRNLTLATKKQQKAWWELYTSYTERAPEGSYLKAWLFGGADIPLGNALFDVADYKGSVVSDLFGEDSYFDDAESFWTLQNQKIAEAKERYLEDGWQEVVILDVGNRWRKFDHGKAAKTKGGRVYVEVRKDGEVIFNEGYITEKEAKKRANGKDDTEALPVAKAELTKGMQNYLALHRHSAVRTELLGHSAIALRLAVAQMIAGSSLWNVEADPQKANSEAIKESLSTNKAEDVFEAERTRIRALLGIGKESDETIVYRSGDYGKSHDINLVFAKLLKLDDASVNMILTFVAAETLPSGSAMVEILGNMLSVNMADHWQPDQVFFDLLRDKEALNSCLKEAAGKITAEAHISSTAKVQKDIIQGCLDGTRTGKKDWQPRYMNFPFGSYTKKGGIEAIDQWKRVKKHFD